MGNTEMCPFCSKGPHEEGHPCPWQCERCGNRLCPGPGHGPVCLCPGSLEKTLALIAREAWVANQRRAP